MNKLISVGTVLLISPHQEVREKIRLERIDSPTLFLKTLEASYRYLDHFKDADMIYLDSSILTTEGIPQLEAKLHQKSPRLKILYLLSSTGEAAQLSLRKDSLYRVLEIAA